MPSSSATVKGEADRMNGLLVAVALALALFWLSAVVFWRLGPLAWIVLALAVGVLAIAWVADGDS